MILPEEKLYFKIKNILKVEIVFIILKVNTFLELL